MAAVNRQLGSAEPLTRLHLVQERMDLEHELAALDGDGLDMGELEAGFIEVALAYSERKGITYEAWRSIGVEQRVLKAAWITK